jgi:hypothetical protein
VMEQTPIFGLRVAEPDYWRGYDHLSRLARNRLVLFNVITRLTPQLMELGMLTIGVISVLFSFVELLSCWEPVPIKNGDADLRQTAKGGN